MTDKTYSKPPVVEIVCQFRFSLPENNPWTSKKPGELLKELSDEYPNFESPQDVGVGIHVKEGSITPELLAPKQRFIYSSENGNCSINIAPDSFAFIYKVNEQNRYESWEKSFQPLLKKSWNKVRQCIGIEHIKSIGVRYINHIDQKYSLALHDALNADSEYLPKAIVSDHLGFFNRSEIASDSQNRLIIQTGIALNEQDANDKIIILDIDRILDGKIDTSQDDLPEQLATLQKNVEDVFFSSISDTLKERME